MPNGFESGLQKVIPAVLLYAFHQNQVLMIQKKDHWNGLGGKLELQGPLRRESLLDAAIREFLEEAQVPTHPQQWRWLGQLWFPDFKAEKKQDWAVTVFWTELSNEQAQRIPVGVQSPEGILRWIHPSQLAELPLWEGDRHFLSFVLRREPFFGTLHYSQGKCTHYEIEPILARGPTNP